MSICAYRPKENAALCVICKCAEDVRAELEAESREVAGVRANDQGGRAT